MDYWLIVIIVIIIILIAILWLCNNTDITASNDNIDDVKRPKSIRFLDGTKYDEHKPVTKAFKGNVKYAEITNNTNIDLYAKVGVVVFGISKIVDKVFHIPAGQKFIVDSSSAFELKLLNMLLGKTALYKLAGKEEDVNNTDVQELDNFPGFKFDQSDANLYGEVIEKDGKFVVDNIEVK